MIEIIIGITSIATALFFGLLAIALSIRGTHIGDRLKNIERHTAGLVDIGEKITSMDERTGNMWDIISRRSGVIGTVIRESKNLGKVKISAEPGENETNYQIEIESPIFNQGLLIKTGKKTDLVKTEFLLFGRETYFTTISPKRLLVRIPSSNAKKCTEYMSFLLKWLDTTYIESLSEIKGFEEDIQF